MLEVKRFVCGPLENNVYLLIDDDSRQCAVVDPGIASDEVLSWIRDNDLEPRLILLTHAHFDHVFDLAKFKRQLDAPIAMHPADLPLLRRMAETAAGWGVPGAEAAPEPDVLLAHGQVLELGAHRIEVRHTPGHSLGQVAFIVDGHAFVGDTLFHRGIGRYDLPGSDFEQLAQSILEQLYTLAPETRVWPGHGPETSIDEERRLNPFIGDGARFQPNL